MFSFWKIGFWKFNEQIVSNKTDSIYIYKMYMFQFRNSQNGKSN
jgi:hypothetical protein